MTISAFTLFQDLHASTSSFLLPNVWDAASAALCQREGAKALATSSAALAWSLGYQDGGALPRHELLSAVSRIMRVIDIPLSVDIEDGYSTSAAEVAHLVCELAQSGVVGINIEDGAHAPALLSEKITAIRQRLDGKDVFINARTDVYLRQLAQEDAAVDMTIERLQQYHRAGANSGFVPGLMQLDEVKKVACAITMPLNIMVLPTMPSLTDLTCAGVRRFSVGPALFQNVYEHARLLARQFLSHHDVASLFDSHISFHEMNGMFPSVAQRQ
ncbi:isocitrate lyase/phosphoenolpyruvate mutase family protein [Undibacterium sp.]|uniref:isocitrate lyase/PEP mutase family protein n=1 Tax=Undibacterium sp. TaxID=1914977 RepID=UPI0037504DD6